MTQTTVILDVANLYCRAKFSTGERLTNGGLFGYFRMVRALEQRYPGAWFVHCMEGGGAAAREEILPEYKGDRDRSEPMFGDGHLAAIGEFGLASGHTLAQCAGLEADDLIGHYARNALGDVVICSGDHDMHQLLRPGVTILKDLQKPPVTIDTWREEYPTLAPTDYWKLLAITGDASDAVPGIKGIGEKKGIKIGDECGWDFERIVAHPKVAEHADIVRRNARLVVLRHPRTAVGVSAGPRDNGKLDALFEKWNFESLRTGGRPYVEP